MARSARWRSASAPVKCEHVLATQCLLQARSRRFKVHVDGAFGRGVTAKDIILALIAQIGVGGGTGCVFEYCGSAIRALSMEERMTVCNMSIEAGARAGLVAPDDTTYSTSHGRPSRPQGAEWDAALARWRNCRPTKAPHTIKESRLTPSNSSQ